MFYAFGHNQYNKHNTIHAEVDCVNHLKKMEKLTDISLIVFRTNNRGDSLLMSKPCNNCMRTIKQTLNWKNYRLKTLHYTDNNEFIKIH